MCVDLSLPGERETKRKKEGKKEGEDVLIEAKFSYVPMNADALRVSSHVIHYTYHECSACMMMVPHILTQCFHSGASLALLFLAFTHDLNNTTN
jgi:hypothetical protein